MHKHLKNWDKLSKEQYREKQGAALHRFLKDQVLKYSPLYKELFKSSGLGPDDIRSIDDLSKIPFTFKKDIAPTKEDPSKPRRLILQPDESTYASTIGPGKKLELLSNKLTTGRSFKDQVLDEYLPICFIATTGRTANPTPFVYTSRDMLLFKEAATRIFTVADVHRSRDFALNAFPYAPHLAFWIVYQGGVATGTPMFHTGGGKVFGTEKIVSTIKSVGATIVVGIPGYIYHIMRQAAERGMDYSKVRMVVLGAERVTRGMKRRLKELLESCGAKDPVILSTLGFTEARVAWIECPLRNSTRESSGYHLYPDLEIMEIVNPETGKEVAEGGIGRACLYMPRLARVGCDSISDRGLCPRRNHVEAMPRLRAKRSASEFRYHPSERQGRAEFLESERHAGRFQQLFSDPRARSTVSLNGRWKSQRKISIRSTSTKCMFTWRQNPVWIRESSRRRSGRKCMKRWKSTSGSFIF